MLQARLCIENTLTKLMRWSLRVDWILSRRQLHYISLLGSGRDHVQVMSRSYSGHLNHSSISNLKVLSWSWLFNSFYLAQCIRAWLWRSPSCLYCEHIQRHVICFINSIYSSSMTTYPCSIGRSRRTNWLPLSCTPRNIPIKDLFQKKPFTTFVVYLWKLFLLCYRRQSPLKSIKILFSLGKSNSGRSHSL